MTRLSDADAYLKKVCTYNETGCGSCRFQTKCPADEPTIDAIPVSWIEERIKNANTAGQTLIARMWQELINGYRREENVS